MIEIDYSRVSCYLRCPVKEYFSFVLNLQPITETRPLAFGDAVHRCLADRYNGKSWQDGTLAGLPELGPDGEPFKDAVARLMENYEWVYRDEVTASMDVEEKFKWEAAVHGSSLITVKGRVDRSFVASDGACRLMEHKTTSKVSEYKTALLQLDTQPHLYMKALPQTQAVVYNVIGSKLPAEPAVLKAGGLSQRKDMAATQYDYFKALKRAGLPIDEYKEHLLFLWKNYENLFYRRVFPRNEKVIEKAYAEFLRVARDIIKKEPLKLRARAYNRTRCEWECAYSKLCLAEFLGWDWKFVAETEFKQREKEENGEADS